MSKEKIMNHIKEIEITKGSEISSAPFIEIVFFDEKQRESFKQTFPVSYFMDQNFNDLKVEKNIIN